jgi:hypothetical protein
MDYIVDRTLNWGNEMDTNELNNDIVDTPQDPNAPDVETDDNGEEGKDKTFTQAELDAILNKKFAQWKKQEEKAKEEAERKAKLSKEEQFQEERKEFEEMKKQFQVEKLINSTKNQLETNKMPVGFAEFIVASDEETTTQKFEMFKSIWNKGMQDFRDNTMVGKSPKGAATLNTLMSKEQFNNMTYPDRVKLMQENKPEYDRLMNL